MIEGHRLASRFLIEHLAGSGGMGRVYRAHDLLTGDPVAVKVLASRDVERERFRREAALLADLTHPRIVRSVAHGETPDGDAYLAMEWLDGEDLSARLGRGAIAAGETIELARQAAEALAAAHARGVVHRDVKPGNLFLVGGRLDDVRVIDFGIALVTGEVRRVTRTGVALGTLGYMAPEQVRGARAIDARADVFALGCVLFECLTGRPPFVGDTGMSILARILLEEAPRVRDLARDVPSSLDDLVARMLAKDPDERPRDGRTVAEALAAIDRAATAAPSAPSQHALTRVEQRVLCVIVIAASDERDLPNAETLPATRPRAPIDERAAIVSSYNAALSTMVDGTIVITVAGGAAATDCAARAARCALALRGESPMVICTGRAEVGRRAPAGEVIDRAAAMLRVLASRAEPGDGRAVIGVDDVTTALLDVRFELRSGASGMELVGERDAFDTGRTLLGKRTPFVGRERELSTLEGLVADAREHGTACAALITAPPGYGKSRLRRELAQRLVERGEPIAPWLGRGDSMRVGAPFGVIGSALRAAAGLDDAEPIDARRDKLVTFAERALAPEDARRVAEFIGEIVGAPFPASVALTAARSDARLMSDQVSRAVRDLIAAACDRGPLLLMLEDLQWGDHPSVKLVDAMLQALRDRPLIVLAFARPEIDDVFPKLWSGRALSHIRLGDLPRRSAARLAREVLGARATDATLERLLELAAGNPLYLEELIRAEAGGGGALPESVLAMVGARLSALDDEARRALRAASIFGMDFRLGGVAALLGRAHDDAAARLDELCERELVTQRGSSRIDVHFAFRHELMREAAYASLTPHDRALGHRIAGAWLDEAGDQDAMVIADHFERGGDRALAATWHRRAAYRALAVCDASTAMERAARGVACGAAAEDLGLIRYVESVVHAMRGESTATAARAMEALDLLPEGGAPWLRAAGGLVVACFRANRFDEATAWVERLQRHEPDGDEAVEALALALAAAASELVVAGRVAPADEVIARVRDDLAPRATSSLLLAARLHRASAIRSMYAGDLGTTLTSFEASVSAFRAIGDQHHALVQEMNVALTLLELGAYERAGSHIAPKVEEAERLGIDAVLPLAWRIASRVLWERGALDEARASAVRAVDGLAARSSGVDLGSARQYLGEIEAKLGNLDGALRELQTALDEARGSLAVYLEVLGAQAEVLLRAGRVADALAAAREGSALLSSEGGGMAERESRLRLVLVEALEASGDHEAAREALATAAASLAARAANVRDPALRRSFLERVSENAKIRALARAWLGVSID